MSLEAKLDQGQGSAVSLTDSDPWRIKSKGKPGSEAGLTSPAATKSVLKFMPKAWKPQGLFISFFPLNTIITAIFKC